VKNGIKAGVLLVASLAWCVAGVSVAGLGMASSAQAAPATGGRIAGTVVNGEGQPQMGASVKIAPEGMTGSGADLLTNGGGSFASAWLAPGYYTVRVTLAGFLPAVEEHVDVARQKTTVLQVRMGTAFDAMERIDSRKQGQGESDDDWLWVLRGSDSTRPILRWTDGDLTVAGESSSVEMVRTNIPRGELQVVAGSGRSGLNTNFASGPGTAFAYDQKIGAGADMIFGGEVTYDNSTPSGGFVTTWLPGGENGPATTVVFRQAAIGPDGTGFRAVVISNQEHMAIGDRITVAYGGQVYRASLVGSATSVRPRVDVNSKISENWTAAFHVAVAPSADNPVDSALDSAMAALDEFPTLLLNNGQTVLAGDWHEELAVTRKLSEKSSLTLAGFHDRGSDTPVFGEGGNGSTSDFLQTYYSNVFAYDGGSTNSWGIRLAYQRNLPGNLDADVVYTNAGALGVEPGLLSSSELRDAFTTRRRQAVGAGVSSHVPHVGTKFSASYQWIGGSTVSQLDPYGAAAYGIDPYLNLIVRQPLPSFMGRMELLADFGNLLAQGYVPLATPSGNVVLFPAYRSFRGGLILQF
jgi:hypothetical protein